MRMWMVDPVIMCRKHLLGEHVECHMLAGCLRVGKSIRGYLDNKALDPSSLFDRHNMLVEEMLRRGYRHDSPIEVPDVILDSVDISMEANLRQLISRCSVCQKRFLERSML
jgi:hypothetical protein